jgi:hypothetical protein
MRSLVSFGLVLAAVFRVSAVDHSADVVVYGGTAGGVIAAVSAARAGATVVLVEPGKHVGGMVSGGLGATDTGVRGAIGGHAREFFIRNREHYATKYGSTSVQYKDCDDGFKLEPGVAENVLKQMLAEAKVTVVFGQQLTTVGKTNEAIRQLTTQTADTFTGRVFIDASYEGDLMAKAGVKYHVGREAKSTYNESLAGVQGRSPAHQWPLPVPAFADGKLSPFIQKDKYDEPGTGDRKVQAYNYRLCLTQVADNRLPWPKPKSYDPAKYDLLARYLKLRPTVTFGQLCHPVKVPNGKTDTNNNGPFSTDHIGANWDYPEGTPADRAVIIQDHIDYQQGLFYFLANDPQVPEKLRTEANTWGLAKDEFPDTAGWPHQLYVREARRMIGEYVMVQADVLTDLTKSDSIGLGSYNADSHHVQRLVDAEGNAVNEGDFQVPVRPYAIPYRSLVPKAAECTNLLVPVCMSASHVAYGSVRMEPVYMVLGQASGVAAALTILEGTSVQAIPVGKLQAALKAQKAVLEPKDVPLSGAGRSVAARSLPGIVIDDDAATLTGDWVRSTANGSFVNAGYQHDNNTLKGKKSAKFTPKIGTAGKYEVYLHYTPATNRATNVPVVVTSLGGTKTVTVNQQMVPPGGGYPLGTFEFAVGETGFVEVQTTDTNGHVVIDAVRFVMVN